MKITSYRKNLILALLTMFSLCACSPKEESINISVQKLIPQDSKIAFCVNANQNIINELKAKAEYKDIISELKTKNQKLEELYQDIAKELSPEQNEVLASFIDAKDVVGSLENLVLNQNISLSYSQGGIMKMLEGADKSLQLAIKIPNADFADKILSAMKQNSQIKQENIGDNTLFEIDTKQENIGSIFICKLSDVFLFTLSKEHMQNIIDRTKTPSKSILDSANFKECISNANSDLWAYVDIEDMGKLLALVQPDVKTEGLKSIGVEISSQSLSSSKIEAKLSFNGEAIKDLYSAYKDFKTQAQAINIYDTSVLYASLKLPQLNKISQLINSLNLGGMQALVIPMIQELNTIDIAIDKQEIEAFDGTKRPRAIANVYTNNSTTIKALLGQFFAQNLTKVGDIDVFKAPEEINIACLPENRVSIILGENNLEQSLAIATSGKINEALSAKINKISIENCIFELYFDAKFFQELSNANADLKQQVGVKFFEEIDSMLPELYKESIVIAKLGITENSLHLIAINETDIDFNILKKIIKTLLK